MTRRLTLIVTALAAGFLNLCAQTPSQPWEEPQQQTEYAPKIDSSLLYKSISEVMPSRLNNDPATVTVHQSEAITDSLRVRSERSAGVCLRGYRVRIYFSNSQNARRESSRAEQRFRESHPECPVYRSFSSPNFKVTAGDFPTRSEALALKSAISGEFPSAFVVMENIYPQW